MNEEEEVQSTNNYRNLGSNISRMSENTTLTDSQLKWYKHNKIFEAIIPEDNKLLCIDCVKESNKKTEKLQISDLSMLIQDKMNENIEVLDRYQVIFSKENSIQDLLRKFFKSIHEILYEIENNKKLELKYVTSNKFGPNVNMRETKEVFENLKCIQIKIDNLIKEDRYEEVAKIRDEYKHILKKAEWNLDGFKQFKPNSPEDVQHAFDGVFKYTISDLDSELSKLVDDYIKIDNLNLKNNSATNKGDKIQEMFGLEKNFKHKSEVTWVLCLKNGMIVSGCLDTNIRIWDPKTAKCIRVLDGHTHAVLCIIELESGYLASGSLDQTVIVWDPNKGKIINMLEGFENPIIGMFELNQKQLVINFNEPILFTWTWNASSNAKSNSSTCSVGDSSLTWVIKHEEDKILCGCEDGKIYRMHPSKSEKPVMSYDKHTDVVFAIESIGNDKFISNSTDYSLILWKLDTGEVLKTISLSTDMVMGMFYEKDQDMLIFSSLDGKIRAVDLSPDIDEDQIKYEIDQGNPIFFSWVIGFKEMKFLSKKIDEDDDDDSNKPIADQVILEEDKNENSPEKDLQASNKSVSNSGSQKNVNVDDSKKSNVNNSKSKINKNYDINKRMSGYKTKIKINGLFDINKQVLDDPEIEEMMSKGLWYVVATVNQEANNSIILWDLISSKPGE